MKRLLIISLFAISITNLFSQTSSDALRYSRIFYNGSARYQGLGGAFGAIGADFSSIATNPGGLGLYSSSEFTISPYMRMENSQSSYSSETNKDNNINIGMQDLGLVFHLSGSDKNSSGFKGFNIAIGVNRENDFNNRIFMEGTNNKNSLLTQYVDVLNNTPGGISSQEINNQYPFDIAPAYNSDLIYYDTVSKKYRNDAPNGGVIQSKSIYTYGSINEYEFAFGANYNDRLYFGVTVGVPVINYSENTAYTEVRKDTAIHYFRSMKYDTQLETHGTGINLKLGLIYRPADWVRIGAAIHTPTYYGNMRDSWTTDMEGTFSGANNQYITTSSFSPVGYYNYQLTTPFRAIGSVAFIIGKIGLISGEYEYVNLSQSTFAASDASFSDVNSTIKNSYKAPVNVRFGTEWRIHRFRIRGGFAYYGSPYQVSGNPSEMYIGSLGWGYRAKHFFLDMTYQLSQTKENYYFYDPSYVDASQNTYNTSNMTATVGFRF
jgi:hypothetical protein